MPRAKTGCDHVLYTLVRKDTLKTLNDMVKRAGVSRPLLVDALIRRAKRMPLPKIKAPEYTPHKRMPRKVLKASTKSA